MCGSGHAAADHVRRSTTSSLLFQLVSCLDKNGNPHQPFPSAIDGPWIKLPHEHNSVAHLKTCARVFRHFNDGRGIVHYWQENTSNEVVGAVRQLAIIRYVGSNGPRLHAHLHTGAPYVSPVGSSPASAGHAISPLLEENPIL